MRSPYECATSHLPSLARRLARPVSLGLLLRWRAALSGCKSESAPYVAAPQPVRAASVTLSAATDTRSYTGTIKPRYESDLGFRVAGKIVERLVNVGDQVSRAWFSPGSTRRITGSRSNPRKPSSSRAEQSQAGRGR